ncbi:MAG TPA: SurA N-terminal domain-containing protein, partial [Ardenticatenaceae bacterium]
MARRTSGTPEEPRFVSRKHISRAEREARRRKQIILGTVILSAVIALLLAGGALYSALVEPNQRVAVVSGEQITRRDYQKRVNYERFRLFQTAEDSREQAEELMSDPQSAQFV